MTFKLDNLRSDIETKINQTQERTSWTDFAKPHDIIFLDLLIKDGSVSDHQRNLYRLAAEILQQLEIKFPRINDWYFLVWKIGMQFTQ